MNPSPNKPYTVLIAEDDPDDQQIVTETLSNAFPHIKLVMVENGREALNYLHRSDILPDVLITDLQMPLLTGMEMLAQLKAHPSFSKLPVVVLSTSKELEDIHKCQALGAALYIVKPQAFSDWALVLKQIEPLLKVQP